MMAARGNVQPDYGFRRSSTQLFPEYSKRYGNRIGPDCGKKRRTDYTQSPVYTDISRPAYDASYYSVSSQPITMPTSSRPPLSRQEPAYANTFHAGPPPVGYGAGSLYNSFASQTSAWESQRRASPEDYDDCCASPSSMDYQVETSSRSSEKSKPERKHRSQQRRPSNRDEFDGPHQYLKRPPPEYIALQERDLPHLPTNLVVQEQDSVLTQVNDRLSQCAFDFVAKYQFPIVIESSKRLVERPQDREWTEWVYLLKRLATKRRIPARVLYNGQIKQFVTILENSLEMRHAAKHQSRPLKDDRNILQLISAGIQVAKLLKDAEAMSYMDQLYIATERKIQERSSSNNRYRSG
ncbi:hypothetical protein F5884DRAFT_36550 [Xylogone sp. PMI_703]|nr:hypothetical protein F5884DRAFT_36550 [Xylogone sp. PMI_703]